VILTFIDFSQFQGSMTLARKPCWCDGCKAKRWREVYAILD